MEKTVKQAISSEAANQISKLMIEYNHQKSVARIWETTVPDANTSESNLWDWQCKHELAALEIEEILLNDFGIKMRDDWTSVTLEGELKLLRSIVKRMQQSRAA
jgi:hypothetical protein